MQALKSGIITLTCCCSLFFAFSSLFAGNEAPVGTVKFTQNKGQWPNQVRYRANIPSGHLYLEPATFTYVFYDFDHNKHLHPLGSEDNVLNGHAFKAKFRNALSSNTHQGSYKTSGYTNYLIGNDRSKWGQRCLSYQQVDYQTLYPNIDLRVKSHAEFIKYDLLIHPGGNPEAIEVVFEGLDGLSLNAAGDLVMTTSVNEIIEQHPIAFQEVNGAMQEVACRFKLTGERLRFDLPDGYDASKTLIIDPTLIFSTFSGASMDNWGSTATYDDDGFAYAGGMSFIGGYPFTTGAFQTTYGGGQTDVAITKYDPTGAQQVYATYLGGNNAEFPHSMIVNHNNELIIYGTTGSNNFPVSTNAYDQGFNGGTSLTMNFVNYTNGTDIFITKLDTSGANLASSTFLGGSNNDGANLTFAGNVNPLRHNYGDELRGEVQVDDQNNIYIASSTRSNDFPVTFNAYQSNLLGQQDGIVAKFDANLTSLIWSTYFGGSAFDAAFALVVDQNRNVYITGGTNSTDLPANAFQTLNQGGVDAYIAHITYDGSSLLNATYLGTPEFEQSYFIDLDDENNVFVFGQTQHTGNFFIKNVIYSDPNSWQYITKFPPNLDSIMLSTVFGSGQAKTDIVPSAFLVDVCNKIYISGWGGLTNSGTNTGKALPGGTTNGLPLTNDAYKSNTDGSDYYLFVLDKDADALIYATYFGSQTKHEHVDGGTSRFDKLGKVYQSVCSDCGGGSDGSITTAGAFATSHSSPNCNNLIFKFDLDFPILIADFDIDPAIGCAPHTADFTNTSSYEGTPTWDWDFGNGQTSTVQNPQMVYTQPGTYDVTLVVWDPQTCNVWDSITKQVVVLSDTTYSLPPDTFCKGSNAQIGFFSTPNPVITYTWSPNTGLNNPNISDPIASPDSTTQYTLLVTSGGLCTDTIFQTVEVLLSPKPNLGNDTTICLGDSLQIGVPGQGWDYRWSPGTGLSDSTSSMTWAHPTTATNYILTVDNGSCPGKDTIFIDVTNALVDADFVPDTTYGCADLLVNFINSSSGSTNFLWDFGDGTTSTNLAPSHTYTFGGSFDVSLVILDSASCNITDTAWANIIVMADSNYALVNDSLCVGDIVQIGIPTIPALTYAWSPANGLSSTTIGDPIANPGSTTTYTLIVSNGLCADTVQQTLVVGPSLSVDLGNDTTVCIGDPPVLIGVLSEPGHSYHWSPSAGLDDDTLSSPLASPTTTTAYVLTVHNGYCFKRDTIVININDLSNKAGNDVTICKGDTILIGLPSEGYTYTWSPTNGLDDPNIAQPNAFPDSTSSYTVLVSDSFCQANDTIQVIVIQESRSALPDERMCETGSVTIGIPSTPGFTYAWSPATGLSNASNSNPIASPDSTTAYTLILFNSNCADTLDQVVEVGQNFTFDLDNSTTICSHNPVQIGLDPGVGLTYAWSPSEGLSDTTVANPWANPDSSTTYTLTVDNSFCDNSDTVRVERAEIVLEANYTAMVELDCDKTTVQFNNISIGANTYLWDFGDGFTTTEPSPSRDLENGQSYEVMLIAIYDEACTDTAFFTYEDVEEEIRKKVPNAFTPNKDGQNDCFNFTDMDLAASCYHLEIFNRWGETVFESEDPTECWNGSIHNTRNDLNAGVFYYILEIKELTVTGWVDLIRN